MTTEILQLAGDLNRDNPVYVLDRVATCTLSGAAYIWNNWEDKINTTERASATLSARLVSVFPDFSHWLFIGNRIWQPDNRVVRHRKLWSVLEAKSIALPAGEKFDEILVAGEQGIKYFGAIKCDSIVGCSIASTLRSSWETQLVFADQLSSVEVSKALLPEGFEHRNNAPPEKIIDVLCDNNVFAYLPLGWFDDRESGCAVFASRRLMVSLFPELQTIVS